MRPEHLENRGVLKREKALSRSERKESMWEKTQRLKGRRDLVKREKKCLRKRRTEETLKGMTLGRGKQKRLGKEAQKGVN